MDATYDRTSWLRDETSLAALHVAIAALLVTGVVQHIHGFWNGRNGKLSVRRSEQSMGVLAGTFAATTVMVTLAVQTAEACRGYKSTIIVFDYSALAYLFFFNGWFRNLVLQVVQARRKEV